MIRRNLFNTFLTFASVEKTEDPPYWATPSECPFHFAKMKPWLFAVPKLGTPGGSTEKKKGMDFHPPPFWFSTLALVRTKQISHNRLTVRLARAEFRGSLRLRRCPIRVSRLRIRSQNPHLSSLSNSRLPP